MADRDQGDEVASLQALSLNRVRVTVDPTTASIKEVGLQQPMVHLVVQLDGGLNLGKLAAAPSSSAAADEKAVEPQKAKSPPVPVTIGVVKLAKAAATFRDESVQPPVQTGLSDLTGTIKGLSSKQLARADVNLTGRVGKVAPLKIAGTINPLTENAFTDLTITLGGMDLTAESPYSGKYVGYRLSKGKLSLDLKYKVSQKQLEAENKVVVDQLTFGEKVDSPDATSLPVPLVVALLEGSQGTDRHRFAHSWRPEGSRLQVRQGGDLDVAQSAHENCGFSVYADGKAYSWRWAPKRIYSSLRSTLAARRYQMGSCRNSKPWQKGWRNGLASGSTLQGRLIPS